MAGTGRTLSAQAASGELKHSTNGLERERVAGIQRARMLAAMAEVCAEHGAGNVTVAHVVERAGVSRRTFYELFRDSEDCFLAAVDDALARASQRVLPAHAAAGRWRERMRASLTALLQFLDEEPYMGRLLVVETLAGGRGALERRSQVLAPVISTVEEGRNEAKAALETTRLTAEGVVGAVLSVIHGRLLEGSRGRLVELVNPLMSMAVLPYLGPAAARRELERPDAKAAAVRGPSVTGNPLKELQMRLTYRTVRVLAAVATHPRSSNRVIADAADVNDQGQISKLLARLEKLGLIENLVGMRSARGEPNAWTLTERGEEVHGALRAQATARA
jgi:AcrR family transcriptional regulator/DNA-binding MarR family transcriptional regulator